MPNRPLPHRFTMRRPDAQAKTGLRFVNKAGATDIYLYDEISSWWGISAQDFVDQLREVETDQINLHINSPGGEIFDAQAIYNALKQHKATVTTYIDALAASAASFIAMAGDQVIAARNATIMIHDGIGLAYGNAADMRDTADVLDLLSNQIADMYYQKAGGSVAEWRALMQAETWYNAEEAKAAGLVNTVLDSENEDAQAASNAFDLSVFNHSSRAEAPSPDDVRRLVLSNRVKEAHMGNKAPKNTDDTQSSQPSGTKPDEQEARPTGDPEQPGTEAQPQETGTEQAPTQPAAPAAPSPAPGTEEQGQTNRLVTTMVNGVSYQLPQAVVNHISGLETWRNEAVETSRINFVEQLAADGKIAATQVGNKADGDQAATGLIAFALSLTDEQYANWAAAYASAPKSSLFENHGVNPADGGRPANGSEQGSIQDRVNTLEAIVADHRRTGMPEDVLKTKNSYRELEALKAQLANQQ